MHGTVADLLHAIPYLLAARIVPPLHVLNELLSLGESEAGMSGGCRWQPFTLTPDEHDELVAALTAPSGAPESRSGNGVFGSKCIEHGGPRSARRCPC